MADSSMPPEYVTVETFQWSIGILISCIVGVMTLLLKHILSSVTRAELADAIKALTEIKLHEHNVIMKTLDVIHMENKEDMRILRESIVRLEAGYFAKFYKNPGDT